MKQWRVLLLLKRSMLEIYKARELLQISESEGSASCILSHPQPTKSEIIPTKVWARRGISRYEDMKDRKLEFVLYGTSLGRWFPCLSNEDNKVRFLPVGSHEPRHRAHTSAVQFCKEVLEQKTNLQWCLVREELNRPIRDVDLVVTIGGDGTLLQASHYLDDSIPVLGVNSDPTRAFEVEEKLEKFDASRSTGHLCGTTAATFKQVLDEILGGDREPTRLSRISTRVDGIEIGTPALNDVLVAHPNPAAVSRCTFSIDKAGESGLLTPTVHSRSSGIRICTSAGSTAAMRSAGGYSMALQSPDLQYMVREPISPHPRLQNYLHGWVRPKEIMHLQWGCRRGMLYFDGSHVVHEINFGSKIEFSSSAPTLKIFVRPNQ